MTNIDKCSDLDEWADLLEPGEGMVKQDLATICVDARKLLVVAGQMRTFARLGDKERLLENAKEAAEIANQIEQDVVLLIAEDYENKLLAEV